MTVHSFGYCEEEGVNLSIRALDVEVNPPVGLILDKAGHFEATGDRERLGPKTDPLDTASVPNITVGDMG